MAQIISFKAGKDRRKKHDNNDLTTLLQRAVLLRKQVPENGRFVHIEGFQRLKRFFEAKIADILIKKQFIDQNFFLCGTYISGILTGIVNSVPESWFAVDYILKSNDSGNPVFIKQGANICFLICSVFKGRSEIRVMRYEDYERMGISLYSRFYSQTGSEIGYHMSSQFKIMVNITDECMRTL